MFWLVLLKTSLLRGSFLKQFDTSVAVVGINKVPERNVFLALHSVLKGVSVEIQSCRFKCINFTLENQG